MARLCKVINGAHSNVNTTTPGQKKRKSFLCPALSQLLSTPVQRRLSLGARLEPWLRPKILSRAFENFPLHELIDPQRILILVPRREVVKRRVNHQFVTFPVIKASLG